MKKSFILLFCLVNFLALNAQDVLLFDFDTKAPGAGGGGTWPWTAWNGLQINDGVNNDGTGAVTDPGNLGNKVAKIAYDGTLDGVPGFLFPLSSSYNTDNYEGFTLKMKSPDAVGLIFSFTLESGNGMVGNWSSFPAYTGDGAWQTLQFPFLSEMKGFAFDRIVINFTSHTPPLEACVIYVDDVTLVKTFSTGIKNQQYDNTDLWSNNGVLNVQNLNGKTEVKVYTAIGAIVYSTDAASDFSVNLKEKGVSPGVLLVALSNGSATTFKKVILK